MQPWQVAGGPEGLLIGEIPVYQHWLQKIAKAQKTATPKGGR